MQTKAEVKLVYNVMKFTIRGTKHTLYHIFFLCLELTHILPIIYNTIQLGFPNYIRVELVSFTVRVNDQSLNWQMFVD